MALRSQGTVSSQGTMSKASHTSRRADNGDADARRAGARVRPRPAAHAPLELRRFGLRKMPVMTNLRKRWTGAACTALTLLWACMPDNGHLPVEHPLTLHLEARHGSVDGALSLQDIIGITLSEGAGDTLFVAQRLVPSILVLSASGDSLGSMGRRGQGPGEFTAAGRVSIHRDTLWVADFTGVVNRFTMDGQLVDQLRFPREPLSANELAPEFVAPLADGALLFRAGFGPGSAAVGRVEGAAHVRVDRRGLVVDTILVQSLSGGFLFATFEDGGRMVGAHPVDWSDRIAVDPRDRWVVRVAMDRSTPTNRFATVSWWGPGGETLAEAQVTGVLHSAADAYESLVDNLTTTAPARPRGMVERAVADQVPWPSVWPPVGRVFADSDGRAWVKTTHAAPDTAAWLVLGPDGNRLGSKVLPARVELLAASGDKVWGWTHGAWGEPYLLRYSLER